jgi:hypothetical protein
MHSRLKISWRPLKFPCDVDYVSSLLEELVESGAIRVPEGPHLREQAPPHLAHIFLGVLPLLIPFTSAHALILCSRSQHLDHDVEQYDVEQYAYADDQFQQERVLEAEDIRLQLVDF